ncbi:MAG: hypothetical protein UY35_C0006G0028 [Candidatus Saccharibacteria bacterium GW2011_GWC2_48_9]|nr:MAG: hypothetical protein UY35_C0006G0028 [Candidatus Saccharibacteria bacterium GW2011_GWC2_48_9]HCH34263.1 hypothetical protein [Candidatus Saccharibacteria bacterium]
MPEIQPRVVASEMEWQITATLKDSPPSQLQLESAPQFFDNSLHPDIVRSGEMLSNGARYYQDVGSHLEYATPEDTRFEEGVVTNELASELFVIDSLARHIKSTEKIQKIFLSKRVIDESNTAWGYHMNLSADRRSIPRVSDEYLHLYGLHLATSQAMLGSGMIQQEGGGSARYHFGQKISCIAADFNSNTTGSSIRPLINMRDEPHTNDETMRRLHVISADPHISPWATRMAFGTSSLVLRAIEQGYGNDLRMDQGGHKDNTALSWLARMNASDISMRLKADYTNGGRYTALEAQRKIIEIVERADTTDEETRVLEEWKRAVADMEQDLMLLQDRSDAIAKLALLQAAMTRYNTRDLSHVKLRGIDETYGQIAIINRDDVQDINDETAIDIHARSIPHRLRTSLFRHAMPQSTAVKERVLNPPGTTRAIVRAHHIRHGATVDWKRAVYPGLQPIVMHPLDNTIPSAKETPEST